MENRRIEFQKIEAQLRRRQRRETLQVGETAANVKNCVDFKNEIEISGSISH